MIDYLKEAANVRPHEKQLKWFKMGMYAFIHFGMNTFTDSEWGKGNEEESLFNPEKLDCDQWARAIKSAGLKGMVLTAKHHDGFCLWPSRYTEHSVKNSPCSKDIVKEASDACRRAGIEFGFYLSPWDRNSKYYGTGEYNDYFCNQLRELLTGYGKIFYVWFDNACGEGKNGIKQNYDFKRYFRLIEELQPEAVIFNDFGPDVRWCGNEAGTSRSAEWSVVPIDLCHYAKSQTKCGPLQKMGDLSYLYNTNKDIGNFFEILHAKGLAFVPSEIDTSIRPGWFWHENEEPKSLEALFNIYLNSVGNNACLNLNVPPNADGLIDERDVKRLRELGELIESEFSASIKIKEIKKSNSSVQPIFNISFSEAVKNIKYVVLSEDISKGQRVESFIIYAEANGGNEFPLYQGNCIGNKKICKITDPFAEQNPLLANVGEISSVKVYVTGARDEVLLDEILIY